MGCGACEKFGLKPGMGAMGQRALPTYPMPKQVDPKTVYLVLGISAAVVILAGFFWYSRKGS